MNLSTAIRAALMWAETPARVESWLRYYGDADDSATITAYRRGSPGGGYTYNVWDEVL